MKERFFICEMDEDPPGLTVFIIRQKAIDMGLRQRVLEMIENRGFDILHVTDATAEVQTELEKEFRGGNWGRGPYGSSGGPPASAVFALDVLPAPVEPALVDMFPLLDNARIQMAKRVIRRIINDGLVPEETFNALHSTDNAHEAWRAVEVIAPDRVDDLRKTAMARHSEFNLEPPGIEDLTAFGNRARVEVVEWGDGLAVRKTFKPNFRRFLQREIAVLKAMAHSRHIPRLLHVGDNHLVIEYFEDDLWKQERPDRFPDDVVRELSDFFKACTAKGFDPIDLTTRNLIMDARQGLKVIDFEFWHQRGHSFPAQEAYALIGVPDEFEGDIPLGSAHIFDPYMREWYPFVRMPLRNFLSLPPLRRGSRVMMKLRDALSAVPQRFRRR